MPNSRTGCWNFAGQRHLHGTEQREEVKKMRVHDVAKELRVSSEALVHLLREMDIPVSNHSSGVDEQNVARIRTVMERERRQGHDDAESAIEAAIQEHQSSSPRTRRRRRRSRPEPEPAVAPTADVHAEAESDAPEDADSTASPASDAAESIAAEASERAEDVEAEAEEETTAATEESDAAVPAQAEESEEAAKPTAKAAPPKAPSEPATPPPPRPERLTRPERSERPGRRESEEKPTRKPRPAPTPVRKGAPKERGGQVRVQAEGFTPDGRRKERDRKRKKRRSKVDQDAVEKNLRKTMAAMESGGGGGGRRRRRSSREEVAAAQERREQEQQLQREEEAKTVRVNEFLTISEVAEVIDVPATDLISSAFKNLGLMVTINQRLDFDQIELLLDEFNFKAVREEEFDATEEEDEEDRPEDLKPRSPVVTVMGHVDHGKTSLLDHIRNTNVIAGESGGITQHIGAYHVVLDEDRSIAFLDTPGHAAFTAMRARGAEITDVVILVVAADDSVMPQTREAISHAKNAGVPMVVAVNKTDLPDSNAMRVKQDLLQHEVVLEEFGGDVLSADVSAKTGSGVAELLEKVLLQADILELQANPDRPAQAVVVEGQLDIGKGPVATVLVTGGTLRVGDHVVCGLHSGRVRAMLDERGKKVRQAGPSVPVQLLGLSGVPQAGDQLRAMPQERASEIAQTRQRLDREKRMRIKSRGVKLTDISRMLERGETADLNLVIKGDVDGSVQALSDSLEQLSSDEVKVQVVHRGVGAINESDVLLASTAGAIVIGFHVRPSGDARNVAEREGVDIRLYNVIYEAVEEVRAAMEGMLSPEEREVMLGTAEVRQLFKVPRVGTVAGCMVTDGVIERRGRVRVVRDAVQVYEGRLGSLKRFKDDVREVREGFECGLNVENFNDVKVGDVLECYQIEEVARTLAGAAAEGA